MYSYDEALDVLGELVDELPEDIFKDLNGGVLLVEDAREADDGTLTMGMYFRNMMGRHVEIYYGSFVKLYGNMENEAFRERLKKTLYHELTHHVENMAGDRSLEHWDERHAELCGFNGIEVHSILFVDDDCSALAPAALAVFEDMKNGAAAEVSACAASAGKAAIELNAKAVKACENLDIDIGAMCPTQADRELLEQYDVALCMTMAQAELLADTYPDLDEKIMCLAEDDIEAPVLPVGWKKCMTRLQDAVLTVIDELNLED